jgi:electron transfer flavoprotein alpha/beta subunit
MFSGTMALELQHTRLVTAPNEMKRTGSRRTKLELPAGLSAASLMKRPSIAPVPAVMEAADITIQVDEDTLSEDSLPFADEEDNPEYVT